MEILRNKFILLGLLLLIGNNDLCAQAPEYQIKAAMLANFALFVGWPETAYATPDSPFVTCVLGSDPFGSFLKAELGDRIGSHPVEVRNISTPNDAVGCHIVFISKSEQSRLEKVLSRLKTGSGLIISDIADTGLFCRKGGMIALKMEEGKVRFDLNAGALANSGYKVDSKLKRLARSTDCGEGR